MVNTRYITSTNNTLGSTAINLLTTRIFDTAPCNGVRYRPVRLSVTVRFGTTLALMQSWMLALKYMIRLLILNMVHWPGLRQFGPS